MAQSLAVIIPTLNEAANIAAAIHSAREAGAAEVIVADGGSVDATAQIAVALGATLVTCERGRGAQLNRGAAAASATTLVFLHADTTLPGAAATAIDRALDSGAMFGGFRISFPERALRLRLAEKLINMRSAITRCPWGDQAQFIRRDLFHEMNGYRPIGLMEDYELALRMKKRFGRNVLLRECVSTSGRRFLERGIWRTTLLNWRTIADFHRGVDPELLAARYRR
jgi:rSAM/selenodomain-associated transferase 2